MNASERMDDRPASGRGSWAARFLLAFLLLAAACFCATAAQPEAQDSAFPKNFRDIPGVTPEEIQAVER
ncbi:MAG: hypothetical protein LBR88_09560, partial [Zoogloeaceae bacterium]|nr:hypothetical protein [Zoogloeaceae bacterium]